MPAPGHDPVTRLNDHHADQVLAVARTFGGHPDAIAARVVAIDDDGVCIEVDDPSGAVELDVRFRDAVPELALSTSMRLAFRELARQANRLG